MTKPQNTIEITLDSKTLKTLESTLKSHANALNIPTGSAEIFIKKSIAAAVKTFKKRKIAIRRISRVFFGHGFKIAAVESRQ